MEGNVMRNFKNLALASTALAGVLALASPASATLQISALVNGSSFFCADQTGCDTNSTPGVLSIGNQTIGGVSFQGSSQFQTFGPPNNTLLTNSLTIQNTTGSTANIAFAVSGTDFSFPTTTFSAAGSGTWLNAAGSSIHMSWFGDTANAQGASDTTDLPGVLLANSGLIIAGAGADSFDTGTLTGPFATSAPYSWTMFADATLISGATASLAGRSQDITADITAVPEPGSLAMFGSMLLVGGLAIRRKQKKDALKREYEGDFLAA